MPPWLQFVAEHRVILWLLLGFGFVNLAISTIYWGQYVSQIRRLMNSSLVEEAMGEAPFLKPICALGKWLIEQKWPRPAGFIQSIMMIAAGIAGLLLL